MHACTLYMYEENAWWIMFCFQHLCCSEDGDVDITGTVQVYQLILMRHVPLLLVYEVKNDSVIMKGGADKYRNSEDSSSKSSDSEEMTWR